MLVPHSDCGIMSPALLLLVGAGLVGRVVEAAAPRLLPAGASSISTDAKSTPTVPAAATTPAAARGGEVAAQGAPLLRRDVRKPQKREDVELGAQRDALYVRRLAVTCQSRVARVLEVLRTTTGIRRQVQVQPELVQAAGGVRGTAETERAARVSHPRSQANHHPRAPPPSPPLTLT
jgi:hypothetical protein